MSLCSENCMICQKPQCCKVNYSAFHGLCEDHGFSQQKSLKCLGCKSRVRILFYHNTTNQCDICNGQTTLAKHQCGKYVCQNCFDFAQNCLFCNPSNFEFIQDNPAFTLKTVKAVKKVHKAPLGTTEELLKVQGEYQKLLNVSNAKISLESTQEVIGKAKILDINEYREEKYELKPTEEAQGIRKNIYLEPGLNRFFKRIGRFFIELFSCQICAQRPVLS